MSCNDILKQGIFDETMISGQRSVSEDLFEWLKCSTYQTVKQKIDSGLKIGLPLEGIPLQIGGSFTNDEFNSWKQKINTGQARAFSANEVTLIVKRNVNDSIIKAWSECIKAQHRGLGLISDISVKDDPSHLVYTVRYIPDDIDDPYPKITAGGFQVVGAIATKPFADGTEIPYAGISTLLTRQGWSAVTVVINTTRGTDSQSVPPSVPPLQISHNNISLAVIDNNRQFRIIASDQVMKAIRKVTYFIHWIPNFPLEAQPTGSSMAAVAVAVAAAARRVAIAAAAEVNSKTPRVVTDSTTSFATQFTSDGKVNRVTADVELLDGVIHNYVLTL